MEMSSEFSSDNNIATEGNIDNKMNQFQILHEPNKPHNIPYGDNTLQTENLGQSSFSSSSQSSKPSSEQQVNSQPKQNGQQYQRQNAPTRPNPIPPDSNHVQSSFTITPPDRVPENPNPYQNISNISQLNHEGISQEGHKAFHISTGCCFKCFPILFFCVGLFALILVIVPIAKSKDYYSIIILLIFGLIFMSAGIFLFCRMYNNIDFIMGRNNLTVIKKAMCHTKRRIYYPGELLKIVFHYSFNGRKYKYSLDVIQTNGEVDNIFSLGSSNSIFTFEEIDYFLYYINRHIQTKMRV